MHGSLRAASLLLASLALAIGAGEAQSQSIHPVNDFVLNAIPGLSKMTVAEARKVGPVVSVRAKRYPSDWVDGVQVTMTTLVLDGAELDFAVHEGRRDFLVSATFTGPKWKLRRGLSIGVGLHEVMRRFGPGTREGNVLRYEGDPDGAPQIAEFTLEGDTVVRIKVTPYTG